MHNRNAAYRGKGKQARAVGDSIADEMAKRVAETAGGVRCMVPRSKVKSMAVDDGELSIIYLAGRKVYREAYPWIEFDELKKKLLEKKSKPSALDLATRQPDLFWHVHYTCVDDACKTVDDALDAIFADKDYVGAGSASKKSRTE